MYYSLPGSSVPGILQARILEWVVISSPADLPNPEIEPRSPALQADSLPSEPPGKPTTEHRGWETADLLHNLRLVIPSDKKNPPAEN